ncbi:MAG: choice-of-anchor tandem repeat NxxGxxAF-containing protein [Planctomycetota bacterium]|nr:choice-of-anchor tandem repeat NxxGxxAF-containing protein [Planctomycetota bacterium]
MSSAAVAGTFTITPFILEGDAAPPTTALFQTFDRPNISESGSVFFAGDTDGDTAEDDVVYLDLQLIAQQGMSAPSSGGGTFSAFEFFETGQQVNRTNDNVFIATLTDVATTANRAVYKSNSVGALSLVAQEGNVADGIAGRLYADFGFAGITDDGRIGYLADLDGATTDDSVMYLGGAILFREGDAVPASLGLPAGTIWGGNFDEIQYNGAGDVLFEGDTNLPTGDMVLVRRSDATGVSTVVAQEGQAIAARDGADTLELILQSAIAENGMWAYRGNLGIAPSTADAFLMTESGFMAQQGDSVPELGASAVLGNLNGIDINSLGDVIYLADIDGADDPTNDEGIFANGMLVVASGQQVPGLPAGTFFGDIGFEDMYINDNRELVFQAGYTGTISGDGLFKVVIPAAPTAGAMLAGLAFMGGRRRR